MQISSIVVAVPIAAAALSAMHNWRADLKPMPGHQISGTATFNGDSKDVVKVTLRLENATPNASLRWHVHKGACSDQDAPIIGQRTVYSAVTADANGRVNATATLPINLNEDGYSVRVHQRGDSASWDARPRPDSMYRRDTTMTRDTTYRDTTMTRDTTMHRWQDSTHRMHDSTGRRYGGPAPDACGDLTLTGGRTPE